LRSLFPTLPSDEIAKEFWTVCSHGFIRQATLSLRAKDGGALPAASLTHDIVIDPVTLNRNGSFVIHPVLFSKLVIRTIEKEFAAFAGAGTPAPLLPKIVATPSSSDEILIPPINLSARGR
jgi:hypothetical protein